MKKTILLSLFALPLMASAQKLTFGLQAGLNPKTSSKIHGTAANYAAGGRVLLGFKHIEAGLGFEMGGYTGRATFFGKEQTKIYGYTGDYAVHTTANYYALYLVSNYKMPLAANLDLYAGIAAGLDIGEDVNRQILIEYKDAQPGHWGYNNNTTVDVNKRDHALALGIQAGARYNLSDALAIQGEVAVRNTRFVSNETYSTFYFPITLGVNIRLAGK